MFWFEQFRHGDVNSTAYQRQIIDTFVDSVYIFDDRVALNFNFKDTSKIVTREEVLGSADAENGPPTQDLKQKLRVLFDVPSNPPKNASPACKLSQNCILRHLFAQKSCLSLHLSAIIKSETKKEDRGLYPQSPFSQRKTLSIKVFLSTP